MRTGIRELLTFEPLTEFWNDDRMEVVGCFDHFIPGMGRQGQVPVERHIRGHLLLHRSRVSEDKAQENLDAWNAALGM